MKQKTETKKRIKRVFTSALQVLHLWANQTQSDARCKNVFFSGLTCYSYGHHYPLGTLIEIKGKTVALINCRGYSATTGKHISYAKIATSHLPTIDVSSSQFFSRKGALVGLRERKAELLKRLERHFRARSFWRAESFDRSDLAKDIAEFNSLAKLFNQKTIKVTASYKQKYIEHIRKAIKRSKELEALKKTPEYIAKQSAAKLAKQAALEKARLEREAAEKLDAEAALASWINGGPLTRHVRSLPFQLVRINNTIVETSNGAQVSIDSAKSFLRDLARKKVKPGYKIEGFEVSEVTRDLVRIGCHVFATQELENLALKLIGRAANLKLVQS